MLGQENWSSDVSGKLCEGGRVRFRSVAASLAALALLAGAAALLALFGERRFDAEGREIVVIDGDSIRLGGEELRLAGIDAPELHQSCEREGRPWRCGQAAKAALERDTRRPGLRCVSSSRDKYGRWLAVCSAGGAEINGAMVRSGMAVSYGRYEREEAEARDARRGLWAGHFERPELWRREHPRAR